MVFRLRESRADSFSFQDISTCQNDEFLQKMLSSARRDTTRARLSILSCAMSQKLPRPPLRRYTSRSDGR